MYMYIGKQFCIMCTLYSCVNCTCRQLVFRLSIDVRCRQVIKVTNDKDSGGNNEGHKFWVLEIKGDNIHRLRMYCIGESREDGQARSILGTNNVTLPDSVKLKHCRMAYDHGDMIYLTDRHGSAVHALSASTGRYLGKVQLTFDALKSPYSLVTDSTGRTLYVGQEGAVTVCSIVE